MNKDGTCPEGSHKVPATALTIPHCEKNTSPTPSQSNQLPTQTGNPGGSGTGTPTTNPGKPTTPKTTPSTPPTPSTSTTTTTSVINRGSSGGGTSSAAGTAPTSAQTVNNNFLNYVNPVKKITIKYPSTWTKTELVGNPSIPVIFNAPTTTTSTPNTDSSAAKTSFVINITPSTAANLDSYTQQQINALRQSPAVKYTITNTNAKELTPPTGITAFREISYDGMKNSLGANNVPIQVPLKGAAIFFVNGGTGYSLLYLAKQAEYTQNLPMIQQMVNSFQIGNSGNAGSTVGGGPVQNSGNASPK
jgi:hypothetical protein